MQEMQSKEEKTLKPGNYLGRIDRKLQSKGFLLSATRYLPTSNSPWHSHENLHMALVFQPAKSETKKETHYSDNRGKIFFYHPEEVHRYTTGPSCSKSFNVELSMDLIKEHHLHAEQIKNNIRLSPNPKTQFAALQYESEHKEQDQGGIQSLLLDLIHPTEKYDNTSPRWVQELRNLLWDCWNTPLSLYEISEMIRVHPVTISKCFSRYFSSTLGVYRRKIKIEKSIELIGSNKMNLTEIAHYCNFADQSHFFRTFREFMGIAPKTFRKKVLD